MTRLLLDTNAAIALMARRPAVLVDRVLAQDRQHIGLPSVVMHELFYGARRSQRIAFNLENLRLLSNQFATIDFGHEDSHIAGEIRADLAAKGTPIGAYDVLIAGQAKARDLILVTNNTREFARVAGLRIEDWTRAA